MAFTKTQVAVAGALLLGGGALVIHQQQEQAALREQIQSLHAESIRLAQVAHETSTANLSSSEIEAMRSAAAELPRLRAEAVTLRDKTAARSVARTQSNSAKKRSASATPGAFTSSETGEQTLPPGDHMPLVKTTLPPVYPAALRQAGISGEAVVSVLIDAQGNVRDPRIVRATHPELESPAIDSIKQWKFEPGQKGGRTVNTRIQIPIVFNIDPEEQNWF